MQDEMKMKKLLDKREELKKKRQKDHMKNIHDELLLSNKLVRQFIMVTSLVMQSEDLSTNSIFNYS